MLLWAFSTFAVGGPQRRFVALAEALGSAWRHRVIAMDGRYDAAEMLPASVDCETLSVAFEKGSFLSRRNIAAMRRVLDEISPAMLLTSNWGCIEWLVANRGRCAVPQLHFEDGFGPDERPDAQNRKRVLARRMLFRNRNAEFVVPSRVLEAVARREWWVGSRRLHLIPNGVDLDRFRPASPVDRAGLTIGTVAALRPEKRIDRLIEAVARLDRPGSRLLVVGDGPERVKLEAQAAALDLHADFAGASADVPSYLAETDIFAMSSDTEQMPIGLVEAMACGLPVAATDVGDIASMVSAANLPFVTACDPAALANALKALAADAELRRSLGAANARRARAEFGLGAMAQRYDTLFRARLSGVEHAPGRNVV